MKWRAEYATGVERIDQQHKSIFKTAEDYRSALDDGDGERTYAFLLDFLDAYCKGHFRFEEKCMEEYHCPVAEKNKEEHAMFLTTLGEFKQRYAASGYLAEDALELLETVDQWLDVHICGVDVHLKGCAKG